MATKPNGSIARINFNGGYIMNPSSSSLNRALLGLAASCVALSFSGTALAQDNDSADAVEEIVVTGTRIKNAAITAASPQQVIGAD